MAVDLVRLSNIAAVIPRKKNPTKCQCQWSVEMVSSAPGSRGGGMISVLYKLWGHTFFVSSQTYKILLSVLATRIER